jgi:hypothetical protein
MLPSSGAGRLACPALLIITVLLSPTLGVAQISTTPLQGKVSDGTGVLPSATVTAGFTQESTTDAEGAFMLPASASPTRSARPSTPAATISASIWRRSLAILATRREATSATASYSAASSGCGGTSS